jgi:hypothetical protein
VRRIAITILVLASTACTELPDIPEPTPPQGAEPDYPALIPLDGLEATTSAISDEDAQRQEAETAARVANLKARASRLRSFQFD